MSYRIYVNDYQCLGNNECPQVLIDELKKQGCKFNNEDYIFENFEIKELLFFSFYVHTPSYL